MDNTTNVMRSCTKYRKDFTPEERAKYNEYMKERMRVYLSSEKGKLKQSQYHKERYQRKKLEKERANIIVV